MYEMVSIHTPVWGVTSLVEALRHGIEVSIHTPVWGVTEVVAVGCTERLVSIHTPVWGVTIKTAITNCVAICFNPHARVGRDGYKTISSGGSWSFNPHARVGRDV